MPSLPLPSCRCCYSHCGCFFFLEDPKRGGAAVNLPRGRQRPTHERPPTAAPRLGTRECSRAPSRGRNNGCCCCYCPCGADGRTPCRGQLAPAHLPAPTRPRDGRSRLSPPLPSSRGRALRAHPVMVCIYTRRQRLRRSSATARVNRLRTNPLGSFSDPVPAGYVAETAAAPVPNGRQRPTRSPDELSGVRFHITRCRQAREYYM